MKKRWMVVLLCAGMLLESIQGVYAAEEIPTDTQTEVTEDASPGGAAMEAVTETATEAVIEPSDSIMGGDAVGQDDTTGQETENVISEDAAELPDDITDISAADTTATGEEPVLPEEDTVFQEEELIPDAVEERYAVALLKSEGGEIRFSGTMVLPEKETWDDPDIVDLRRFAPMTEVVVEAIPDEGYNVEAVTAEYSSAPEEPVFLAETDGRYVLSLPAEDIRIRAEFSPQRTESLRSVKMLGAEEELLESDSEETILASGSCGSNVSWELTESGLLTISGSGMMDNYSSAAPWDEYKEQITSLQIEEGVYSIGGLSGTGITSAVLPRGLYRIDDYAFKDCTLLETVVVQDDLGIIGYQAFSGCLKLEEISLPESLAFVDQGALISCKKVYFAGTPREWEYINNGSVTASDCEIIYGKEDPNTGQCGDDLTWVLDDAGTLTISGTGDMYDYNYAMLPWGNKITALYIEKGVTSIGNMAFRNCTSLAEVHLANTVGRIGNYAFAFCYDLTDIVLPEGLTELGPYAFYYDTALKSIVLPDNLTAVNQAVFQNCNGLRSAAIGKNISSIAEDAFLYDYRMEEFSVDEANAYYKDVDGALLDKAGTKVCSIPGGIRSYCVPDGVTTIGKNAVGSSLESLTLPKTVVAIEANAFAENLYYLKTIYYGGTEEEWNAIAIGSNNALTTGISSGKITVVYNYNEGDILFSASVSPESVELLNAGDTAELTVTANPASAADKMVITTSDESVATIEGTTVTAVGSGTCEIIVSDQNKKKMASCRVTVRLPIELTVENGTGSGTYRVGDFVRISADPAEEGMQFAGWTGRRAAASSSANGDVPLQGSCSLMDETVSIVMPDEPYVMTANYEPAGTGAETTVREEFTRSNVEYQDYNTYGSVVSSYLAAAGDEWMRIQAGASRDILVEYYTEDFDFIRSRHVRLDLPLFGGFYEAEDCFYVVSGQINTYESDEIECYRVTKYDKDWNRLASAGLKNCNTYYPFDAGSCRMAMEGKYLVVHTSHEMYMSADGYHHQSNVTFQLDTETMTFTQSRTGVSNTSTGYVSHSFNQFARIDGGKLVTVDHGDGYPRSFVLIRYKDNVADGSFGTPEKVVSLMKFAGSLDENATNASVGGFEVSDTSYLVAGNSADQSSFSNKTRNIFLCVMDREMTEQRTVWLTNYAEGETGVSTPQLVPLDDGTYLLLWSRKEEEGQVVYYQKIDGAGNQIGDRYEMPGNLSDCCPVQKDGIVNWYVNDGMAVTFYRIDPDTMQASFRDIFTPVLQVYMSQGDVSLYVGTTGQKLNANAMPLKATDRSLRWESSDPSVVEVDQTGTLTPHAAGEAAVRAVSVSNPDVYAECKVSVYNYISNTTISFESPQTYTGQEIRPEVTVKDGEKLLVEGTDYELAYSNNVAIGRGSIRISGLGSYISYVTMTFTISPKPFSDCTAEIPDVKYTGTAQEPAPVVRSETGEILTEDTDYVASYSNNTNIGTATVYLYGRGIYSGTLKKEFRILPPDVTGVELNRTEETIYAGRTLELKATVSPWNAGDLSVTWSSSDPSVASVDEKGMVTAKSAGTAVITVTTNDGGKTAECRITVEKSVPPESISMRYDNLMVDIGDVIQLWAEVGPANASSTEVTWSSSDESIASVDDRGYVTAKKPGTVTITAATVVGNKKATCRITVDDNLAKDIFLTTNAETIAVGGSVTLKATILPTYTPIQKKEWKSSNTAVATVDANGKVTGKKAGIATITVSTTDGSNRSDTCVITVRSEAVAAAGVKLDKTKLTMGNGQTAALTATVIPSDALNKKVKWKSSNTGLATVNASGVVTTAAAANGTVTITAATEDGSKAASCTITVKKPSVSYRTHVQTYGWQDYVKDGEMSGTSGQSKRLEGINIELSNLPYSGDIIYRTHVQTYGWQNWKQNGDMSGTSGESKRLEGIQIYLTGELAEHYDIYYRVHAQTYGWLDYAKNGVMAGTSGLSRRLEGINIVLVPKGSRAPGATARPYVVGNGGKLPDNPYKEGASGTVSPMEPSVAYRTHVQTYGWQNYVYDGAMSGTSGESKRLEGIQINLVDKPYVGDIMYRTHVQTYGWQAWKKNGEMSGTSGESKRLEGIQIYLTGEMAKHYDVYYRVHAQTYGWLGWAKNGEMAGTSGLSRRLEGINIKLVPKGGAAPGSTARPNVVGGSGSLPDNPYR